MQTAKPPSTFPETIAPAGAGTDIFPEPTPGSDLGARDYRENPSFGQLETEGLIGVDRDRPNALGMAVGPMPDRTIQTYDLPDQLSAYDRMGRE